MRNSRTTLDSETRTSTRAGGGTALAARAALVVLVALGLGGTFQATGAVPNAGGSSAGTEKAGWLTADRAVGTDSTVSTDAAPLQSGDLPPVPKQALEPYLRAYDVIDMLNKRPDQAAGSSEWDVVVKRLMEAQGFAPEAPLILRDLGLANQLRGRASAAVAWFKAAYLAIEKVRPGSPQLAELTKRIERLEETPKDQVELALTFAKGELPFIHAKNLPDSGVHEDVWPSRPTAPMGPIMVQLPNGKYDWNPAYINPDGSPKPQDIPQIDLEEFLIKLRLGIGDESGIAEAEEHFKSHYQGADALSISLVCVNAYKVCLQALTEARAWPEITHLADRASIWCAEHPTAWTDGMDDYFRKMVKDAIGKSAEQDGDMLERWLVLAKELAASDDEIYFQAKIDGLRRMTVKGEALLEGLASAVRPIGRNVMRLKSL